MYSRVLLYETMTKGSPKKNSKTRPPIFRRKRVSLVKITVSKLVIVMSDFFDDSGSNEGKSKKCTDLDCKLHFFFRRECHSLKFTLFELRFYSYVHVNDEMSLGKSRELRAES